MTTFGHTGELIFAVAWCLILGAALLLGALGSSDSRVWRIAYALAGCFLVALGVAFLLGWVN